MNRAGDPAPDRPGQDHAAAKARGEDEPPYRAPQLPGEVSQGYYRLAQSVGDSRTVKTVRTGMLRASDLQESSATSAIRLTNSGLPFCEEQWHFMRADTVVPVLSKTAAIQSCGRRCSINIPTGVRGGWPCQDVDDGISPVPRNSDRDQGPAEHRPGEQIRGDRPAGFEHALT